MKISKSCGTLSTCPLFNIPSQVSSDLDNIAESDLSATYWVYTPPSPESPPSLIVKYAEKDLFVSLYPMVAHITMRPMIYSPFWTSLEKFVHRCTCITDRQRWGGHSSSCIEVLASVEDELRWEIRALWGLKINIFFLPFFLF